MRRAALLALGALALGTSACAGTPDGSSRDVSVAGCPLAGVEVGCIMLRAPDGQLFNITAADPKPALDGRMIRLRGAPSSDMDFCMQGTKLAGISWSYTGAMCPR
jgi:hypothetical protein